MRRLTWIRIGASLLILLVLCFAGAWYALHTGLQRAHMSLDNIDGLSLETGGMALAGLSLRRNDCLILQADQLHLHRQSGRWQLGMARLSIDDQCPAAATPSPPTEIVQSVLALAAQTDPDLDLEIGQLQWQTLPALALSLQKRARQWQLELEQAAWGKLTVNLNTDTQRCGLQAQGLQWRLQLAGLCLTDGRLELAGKLDLPNQPLALTLAGTADALNLGFHSPTAAPIDISGQASLEPLRRTLNLATNLRQGQRNASLQLQVGNDAQGLLAGKLDVRLTQTGSLPLKAALQGTLAGRIDAPELVLAPNSQLHLDAPGIGALELRPAGPLRLAYQAQVLQLAGVTHWQTTHGRGRLDLALNADLQANSWQGDLHLAGAYALGQAGTLTLDNPLQLDGPLAEPRLQLPTGSRLRLAQPVLGPWHSPGLALSLESPLSLTAPLTSSSSWRLEPLTSSWNGRPLPVLAGRLTLSPGSPLWHTDARLTLGDRPLRLAAKFGGQQARLRLYPVRLPLAPWLPLLINGLQSVSGELALEGDLRWQAGQALRWQASGRIEQFSGRWQESLLAGISGGFKAEGAPDPTHAQGFVEFAELNTGIPLTQGLANWQLDWQNHQPRLLLSRLQTRLLGGILTAEQLHYPAQSQADPLHLSGLSLAALSQLQQEPAVKLEGRLSAELPVRITPEGVEIRAGRLRNQGQARLELLPSPGVESWLNSQPQLARVGDYLRQMTVQQLDARLDLSPRGQLQLDAKLEGRSLGRSRQPLRLNYHHEENLLELLASLRMSDRFSQAIERRLQGNPQGESRP